MASSDKSNRATVHNPYASLNPLTSASNDNNEGRERRVVPEVFGQAEKTGEVKNAAARLATAFRKSRQLPTDMLEGEFEGDNLANYFYTFARWASRTAVPKKFDENLHGPKENDCISKQTKLNYIGNHLDDLRRNVVPKHPDFESLRYSAATKEYPQWWTELRSAFITEAERFENNNPGDEVFGRGDILPLYRDLRKVRSGPEDDWDDDPRAMVDVRMILVNLFRTKKPNNNNMELANLIADTFDAAGRGGEVKFQNYNDWRHDYALEATDAPWHEAKVIDCYSRPGISDDDWPFDFHAVKGAFYMCERGLHRTDAQKKRGIEHTVYPSLYNVHNNSVAKKISKVLKQQIVEKLGQDWTELDKISSKSLRSGAITQMSMFPSISIFQVACKSGHSSQFGNLKSYLDKKNLAAGMPAANALHDKNSLYTKSVLPSLKSIHAHRGGANETTFKALMGSMFTVTINDFKVGEKHHIILSICALSLIRHYRSIMRECGTYNQVTGELLQQAHKVGITHLGRSMPAAAVLEVWSDLINNDIQSRQKLNDVKALSDHPSQNAALCSLLVSISDDVREQKAKTNCLASDLAATKATNIQMMEQNLSYKGVIARLTSEKASLLQRLDEKDEKYRALYEFSRSTNLKTPERKRKVAERTTSTVPQPSNKIHRLSSDFEMANYDDEVDIAMSMEENVSTAASYAVSCTTLHMSPAPSIAHSASTTPAEAPSSGNTNPSSIQIQWNHHAENSTAERSGDAKKRFLNMLLELAIRGLVKPGMKLQNIDLTEIAVANPSKLKHCLEVADFVCDNADIEKLSTYGDEAVQNDNDQRVAVVDAGVRIEDAVFKKLHEFEKFKNRTKTVGRSFLALSKRLVAYKNEIKTATNDTRKVGSIPLMEREELDKIKDSAIPETPENQQLDEDNTPDNDAAITNGERAENLTRARAVEGGQTNIQRFTVPVVRSAVERSHQVEDGSQGQL